MCIFVNCLSFVLYIYMYKYMCIYMYMNMTMTDLVLESVWINILNLQAKVNQCLQEFTPL